MRWSRVVSVVILVVFFLTLLPADDWSGMKKRLARAVAARDKEKIEGALIDIVAEGGAKAVRLILDVIRRVPLKEADIYWQLVSSLSAFTDTEAMEEIGDAIVNYSNIALGKDILFVLQRNRTVACVAALRKVILSKTPFQMRRLAVEILGNIREVESVDALIEALKKTKDAVRADIVEILSLLTGARMGDNPKAWEDWWKTQRPYGMPKLGEDGEGKEGKGLGRGMTGTAVDELDDVRRNRYFGLERLKFPVLVIRAKCEYGKYKDRPHDLCFDRIEDVLDRMKIPNKVVYRIPLKSYLEMDIPDIPKGTIAICINCTQMHEFCVCPFCRPGAGKHDRLYP